MDAGNVDFQAFSDEEGHSDGSDCSVQAKLQNASAAQSMVGSAWVPCYQWTVPDSVNPAAPPQDPGRAPHRPAVARMRIQKFSAETCCRISNSEASDTGPSKVLVSEYLHFPPSIPARPLQPSNQHPPGNQINTTPKSRTTLHTPEQHIHPTSTMATKSSSAAAASGKRKAFGKHKDDGRTKAAKTSSGKKHIKPEVEDNESSDEGSDLEFHTGENTESTPKESGNDSNQAKSGTSPLFTISGP